MKNNIIDKENNFLGVIIILSIICFILTIGFVIQQIRINGIYEDNLIIPKSMSGFIYPINENSVVLKLDLDNVKHFDLLKRINTFCKSVGIEDCSIPF